MNIYLDVDDVVLDWHPAYAKRFNVPLPTAWVPYDDIKHHLTQLQKEKDFWLSIKVKHMPNFRPAGYVSARGIPLQWTKDTLKLRNFPGRSKVRHVHWGESKIEVLKSLNCEIFIDDKIETFEECWANGIFCLLMDTAQNQSYKTKYRIMDLDINKINQKYYSWLKFQ